MAFRMLPLMVEAGVGGVDGALQVADARGGRVQNQKQFSAWFEAGALIGGAILDSMRFSPEITEPLMLGGAALLSRRVGIMLTAGTPPVRAPMIPFEYAAARPRGIGQFQDIYGGGGGGGGDGSGGGFGNGGVASPFGYDPMNRIYPTGILG